MLAGKLVGYLGMEGNGGPGRFRALVGVLEVVGLGIEAPEEEESGDSGGEEDEYHPQRTHFPSSVRPKELNSRKSPKRGRPQNE